MVTVKQKSFLNKLYKQRYLFLMSIPILIWLIIFAYIPLAGWSYAFVDFTPGTPVTQSEFVGLKYFKELFADAQFWVTLKNTVIMSGLSVLLCSFLCPVIFALLLNETRSRKLKRTIQTVSYLPHFVSWVVVSGIVLQMLSSNGGIIHSILIFMGVIDESVNIIAEPKYFYTVYTLANIWKELGWSAIIYISAIAGIDQELYEAVAVDGAGRLRKIWHITLPGIRNTIIILLIMNIGSIFGSGFEAQMLLSNPLNKSASEVLGLYVLNYGIGMQRYSLGTAAGIFTSLCSFALVYISNLIFKKMSDQALF